MIEYISPFSDIIPDQGDSVAPQNRSTWLIVVDYISQNSSPPFPENVAKLFSRSVAVSGSECSDFSTSSLSTLEFISSLFFSAFKLSLFLSEGNFSP